MTQTPSQASGAEPGSAPLVRYEDAHVLVVSKPPGLPLRSSGLNQCVGLAEWLRDQTPEWTDLEPITSLSTEASGLVLFAKTSQAHQSLKQQLQAGRVLARFVWRTPAAVPWREKLCRWRQVGVKPHARPSPRPGSHKYPPSGRAEILLRRRTHSSAGCELETEASPELERDLVRLAAQTGVPVQDHVVLTNAALPSAARRRVCLHLEQIIFEHPTDNNRRFQFVAKAAFEDDPALLRRRTLFHPRTTTAFRLVHGASDGWPGWYVDRLGPHLLSQSEKPLSEEQRATLQHWLETRAGLVSERGQDALDEVLGNGSVFHKTLLRDTRRLDPASASPQPILGSAGQTQAVILENGLRYELRFSEGYSVGLFLDQRDNRRRFQLNYVGPQFPVYSPASGPTPELLNTFAYTCGFGVAAAAGGLRTVNLDLSRKYLDWGRRNYELNGLDPQAHDFIYGDVFDWLRRFGKRGRRFDVVVLDPPTFSKSKQFGAFSVMRDYRTLLERSVPLLKSGGVLLACTNAAQWKTSDFLSTVTEGITAVGRRIIRRHLAPQPLDFLTCPAEPAYLKTVWLQLD